MLTDTDKIMNNPDLIFVKDIDNKNLEYFYIKTYFGLSSKKLLNIERVNKIPSDLFMFYIKGNNNLYLRHIENGITIPICLENIENKKLLIEYLRNSKTTNIKYQIYEISQYNIHVYFYIRFTFLLYSCYNYLFIENSMDFLLKSIFFSHEDNIYINSINFDNIIQPADNIILDNDHYIHKNVSKLLYTPYMYQLNNVVFMSQLEINIDNDNLTYNHITKSNIPYFTLPYCKHLETENKTADNNVKFYYDGINRFIYTDKTRANYNKFYKLFNFCGGVLCDEVGIGKTLSSIYLIVNSLQNNISEEIDYEDNLDIAETEFLHTTLIICPKRLVQHWSDEFKKFTKPDTIKIHEFKIITDVVFNKNRTLNKFLNSDVLIVPLSLLSNDAYNEALKTDNPKYFNILKYNYKRIILDEGHEILFKMHKLKADKYMANILYNLKAKYKWVLSGTPFSLGASNFEGILLFLMNEKFENVAKYKKFEKITEFDLKNIIEMIFRRNTEESIKKQIMIPKIIKKTKFLSLNVLEKSLYDNAVHMNDEKLMLQLCSNIYVNDNIANLLGNRKLNLEQINNEMVNYFKEKTIEYEDNIEKLLIQLQTEEADYSIKIVSLENDIKLETSKTPKDEDKIKELREEKNKLNSHIKYHRKHQKERTEYFLKEIEYNESQIKHYNNINTIAKTYSKEKINICPIFGIKIEECIISPYGHYYSKEAVDFLLSLKQRAGKNYIKCPYTGNNIDYKDLIFLNTETEKSKTKTEKSKTEIIITKKSKFTESDELNRNKWGTKMTYLIKSINKILNKNITNKIIVFSQWKKTLNIIADILLEEHLNYVLCTGNIYVISKSISKFKNDINTKIILLCSETCSSGINLIEASHVIFIDTLNNNILNVKAIQEQAIARAVRLGQTKNVVVYNYIMQDTIEHDYYNEFIK